MEENHAVKFTETKLVLGSVQFFGGSILLVVYDRIVDYATYSS